MHGVVSVGRTPWPVLTRRHCLFAACSAQISWAAFGSFAVPIRCEAVLTLNLDSFVFQVYKSACVMLVSVLLLAVRRDNYIYCAEPIWGALIWVPGGVFAILAVRTAGLGISTALWSSVSIITSFLWGVVAFDEEVQIELALGGLVFIVGGVSALTYSSLPDSGAFGTHCAAFRSPRTVVESVMEAGGSHGGTSRPQSYAAPASPCSADAATMRPRPVSEALLEGRVDDSWLLPPDAGGVSQLGGEGGGEGGGARVRAAGWLCAMVAGFMSGTMYIPVKDVPDNVDGLSYTITFGIAAGAITFAVLCVYVLWRFATGRPALAFHPRRTLIPGMLCGLLFSTGNIAAVYVADYLSQSVGVALTNCSLLVSSAWGILYYHEVEDARRIRLWFLAAVVTMTGMTLLGFSQKSG